MSSDIRSHNLFSTCQRTISPSHLRCKVQGLCVTENRTPSSLLEKDFFLFSSESFKSSKNHLPLAPAVQRSGAMCYWKPYTLISSWKGFFLFHQSLSSLQRTISPSHLRCKDQGLPVTENRTPSDLRFICLGCVFSVDLNTKSKWSYAKDKLQRMLVVGTSHFWWFRTRQL